MNWFLTVLKEHYADFNGRARRKDYWMFVLWNLIVAIVLGAIVGALIALTGIKALMVVVYLYGLAVLLPSLALAVRRLHDIGKSGLWYLIGLVPYVGGIVLLIFFCLDSQPGPNKWGANPKGM